MSKLDLTVSYAILNKNYDTFGKMENFVKVKASSGLGPATQYKTKIVEGEKDKKIYWQETISIPLKASPNASLEFQVLDQDTSSYDICGQGKINLNNCGVFNGTNKYTVRLHNDKNGEISGELHVTTRYY